MARKTESISDKIVRLYKEGYYVEEIAKMMEMPKDNVPKILEKHMPDYESFVQPERDHEAESEKSSKKSVLSTPVSALFKRKSKKNDEEEPDLNKVSVNLTMNENGFIDRTVASIASMLQKGKTPAEMAEFFSKDISDIKAIENVMGEHFARLEQNQEEETVEAAPAVEEPAKPAYARPNVFTSGLETGTAPTAKPVYSKRDEPAPISQSYGLAPEPTPVAEPEPAAEPVSAPVVEEVYHEPVYVEPASYVEPEFSKPAEDEIPEMPSIDPVSLDELDKELSKAPEPTPEIPAIGEDDVNNDTLTNNFAKEDESGMSPMEKMKKFAEEQIALNNRKIEELQSKKIDAENAAFDSNTKVTNVQKQIEELQLQLASLESEKAQAAEIVTSINEEIETIQKENAEFGSYIGQ